MRDAAGERPDLRRSQGIAVLALMLTGCGAGAGSPSESAKGAAHPLLGAPAPAFELHDSAGGPKQSLAANAGKVVVVDFWATWCQPCRQSFPTYQKLVQSMNGELVVLAISQDDDTKGIAAFVSETGAKFPVLWDDNKAVAESYDPPTMPTAFVVDKNGIIRFVHAGYRVGDEATLEEDVRSLTR